MMISTSRASPIFVMSFNRPEYLEKVLKSLSKQADCNIGQRKIFLFQDGAVNPYSNKRYASEEEIRACVDAFQQLFPDGTVVESPINLGIALNFERAEKFGFEDLTANAGIFLEDDLVLNDHYIAILDNLIARFSGNQKIGYLAAYGDHSATIEEQVRNKDKLILLEHNWGFALYRRHWLRMRKHVREYLRIVENSDYNDRDVEKIRALFASWGYGCPATSQDAAKTISCCIDGVIKLNTYICNGVYIGERGVHMNPQLFVERGYDKTALYRDKVSAFRAPDTHLYDTFLKRQRKWAGKPFTTKTEDQADGVPLVDFSPRKRKFVSIDDEPLASALFTSAKTALGRGDVEGALEIFCQGMEVFPNVIDSYENPVFGKEAIRLLLSRNDMAGALEVRQRLRVQHGPFEWDQILFARHYTAAGNVEEGVKAWKSVLSRAPNDAEALAGIIRLELQGRIDQRLKRYLIDGGFNTINGNCDRETLHRINQFHELQIEREIVGDLVEIGVYHGRLFIMLALLARPQERAIAIDVFDVERNYDSSGGSTTLEIVKKNYSEFVGDPSEFHYIAKDSLFLTSEAIKKEFTTGNARVVSIDGAHGYLHTEHDMRLAESVLAPGGVVMVDDITNSGWPGVMEGVARYFLLGSERRLLPFMMSLNKLWSTTCDYHKLYLDFALKHVRVTRTGQQKRTTNFFGCDMVGW
jgi:tetratricopeptide (TPR) repeat protein